MRGNKLAIIILVLIFLFSAGFRMFFALQTDNFTYDAYFTYRQVGNIKETGAPIIFDKLSYGGREFLFQPIYQYILAFFTLFMPFSLALKIIPNILASSIVVMVYLITKLITKNEPVSLFTAFMSIFVPIYFISTLNTLSTLSLQMPLIFLTLYWFMLKTDRAVYAFAFFAFVLPFISATSAVLVVAFIAFLVWAKIENIKVGRKSIEMILLYSFVVLWRSMIIFKKAFFEHGPFVIWQNVPAVLLNQYFSQTTIAQAVLGIGVIPVIVGAYIGFWYIFRHKNEHIYLLLSLALSLVVLLWFRFIAPTMGLSIIGIILVILSGVFLSNMYTYLGKTKFSRLKLILVFGFVLLVALNLVSLTILFAENAGTVSKEEMGAMNFLSQKQAGAVIAPVELGHMITAIAKQPNIADTDFMLVNDAGQRLGDISIVYSTPFELRAIGIASKYNASYLYVPKDKNPSYIEEKCFKPLYYDQVKVYEITCGLEVEK
jgi:hypothetical protein